MRMHGYGSVGSELLWVRGHRYGFMGDEPAVLESGCGTKDNKRGTKSVVMWV